jgi:hypothetical protein
MTVYVSHPALVYELHCSFELAECPAMQPGACGDVGAYARARVTHKDAGSGAAAVRLPDLAREARAA